MQAIGVEAELATSVTPSLERPRQADHGDLAIREAVNNLVSAIESGHWTPAN